MARAKKSKTTVENTKQLNDKNNFESNDENIELANVGSLESEVIVGSCNGTDIPVIPDAPPGVIPDEYFILSEDIDGKYYIVGDNGSGEILYHLSGDVVIPSEFNGLPVKEIGFRAFDNSAITSVVIPNSVTIIGEYAFYYCKNLASINIPNSITTISELAFNFCTSLTSIVIPDSVTTIGNGAFSRCTSLTSINIPNSVTTIGSSTFNDCSSLTSINIPNSVTTIDYSAFSNCSSLTNVIIKGKPIVYSNTFYSTPKLEKIYVIDGQGYASTDKISGKPIKILPSTPAVVVKEMNVETMII